MPAMRICPNCGAEMIGDALGGLCPKCVAQLALGPMEDPRQTIVVALPPTEKAGDRIGRYKLLQQIGEGGCGVVYMAEQEEPVRRRVALKVIKLGMDTKQVIARFEAERQALALMDHPNIAKVFDAGATESGRPYFVMELVKGIPITRYCDENNLSTVTRLCLFIQVCQAIQHAHHKGIIHRDIKPSNVLVADHDGVPMPKIIDFGIAKATTDQRLTDKTLFTALEQFIGTPAYMSPEQAKLSGLEIDTRSDIYSLGVLLYELLTGKTPFEAKRLLEAGLDEIRRIIREEEPVRPSTRLHTLGAEEQTKVARHRQSEPPKLVHLIQGDLDWIAMKCLEKDRSRRYETPNNLARDIQRHLDNEPVVACPPSNFYRFQKLVRRNKLAFGAAAALGVLLVLGLAMSFLFIREKEAKKKDQANASRAEAASIELRTKLSVSDFQRGTELISQEQRSGALAYLMRSLSENPSNVEALTGLRTLLASHYWVVPDLWLKPGKAAQFSPHGKWIFTVSRDGTTRVWEAEDAKPLSEPWRFGTNVLSAQIGPDGTRILTVSRDGTSRVWEAENAKPLTEPWQLGTNVHSAQFSLDGKRIVTVSPDGAMRVLDTLNGQLLAELRRGDMVTATEFSPNGKGLDTPFPPEPTRRATTAQFSPDGKRIICALTDHTARVIDAQSGQLLAELKHDDMVTAAQYSTDGKWLVTASADHTARVWDAQSGQQLTELKHGDKVTAAQFSPDGEWIVTASADGTVRLWDVHSGKLLTEPLKHGPWVTSAQFSPDGKRIITASADNTVQVWDVRSGPPLTEALDHGSDLTSAQFGPDAKRIVPAPSDGTARVSDIATLPGIYPEWLPQLAEAISGLVLNTNGVLVPTRLNRTETLRQIGQKLNQAPDHDDWVVWGLWFLADAATRTIAPFSKTTVPQYIENLIKENTASSLGKAERSAIGNTALLKRVSEARRAIHFTAQPEDQAVSEGEAASFKVGATGIDLSYQWYFNGSPISAETNSGLSLTKLPSTNAGKYYAIVANAWNSVTSASAILAVGPPDRGQNLQVDQGVISFPFILTNGYVCQTIPTVDISAGGRAAFTFNLPYVRTYEAHALVNNATGKTNSVYVSIDSEPEDPVSIWDVPPTAGFEEKLVTWRRKESAVDSQASPRLFKLPKGEHHLILRGRGADLQFKSLSLTNPPPPPQPPSPPSNLRVIAN